MQNVKFKDDRNFIGLYTICVVHIQMSAIKMFYIDRCEQVDLIRAHFCCHWFLFACALCRSEDQKNPIEDKRTNQCGCACAHIGRFSGAQSEILAIQASSTAQESSLLLLYSFKYGIKANNQVHLRCTGVLFRIFTLLLILFFFQFFVVIAFVAAQMCARGKWKPGK